MAEHPGAVITGDIINSSHLTAPELDGALSKIASIADHENATFMRYRGDGWQVLVRHPQRSLRLALKVLAALRQSHAQPATRLAIGHGSARLTGDDLATASGTAFETSGRLLDKMPARQTFAVGGMADADLREAVLILSGQIATTWTRTQADAVGCALHLTTAPDLAANHADVARQLGITRQAAQARLAGAGFNALMAALIAWEATT